MKRLTENDVVPLARRLARIGTGRRAPALWLAAATLGASLALVACGGEEAPSTDSSATSSSSGAVLPGGGLSVAEAITTDAEPPLAVTGWLVRTGESARICSSYAPDGEPPCGAPSLALRGEVTGATGERINVLGSVEGDTFVLSSTVQG